MTKYCATVITGPAKFELSVCYLVYLGPITETRAYSFWFESTMIFHCPHSIMKYWAASLGVPPAELFTVLWGWVNPAVRDDK